eukprot:m.184741 g.184741  ORF g.184741 m.184741 type:complete len:649 (-) comp32205_c0_seq1:162-2108(-)
MATTQKGTRATPAHVSIPTIAMITIALVCMMYYLSLGDTSPPKTTRHYYQGTRIRNHPIRNSSDKPTNSASIPQSVWESYVEEKLGQQFKEHELNYGKALVGVNTELDRHVAMQLARISCKLLSRDPVTTVFVGSSNTDGRHEPFYTDAFEMWMNSAFPSDAKHKVFKHGGSGAGSCSYAKHNKDFAPIETQIRTKYVDAIFMETEHTDQIIHGRTKADLDQAFICLEAIMRRVREIVPNISFGLVGMRVNLADCQKTAEEAYWANDSTKNPSGIPAKYEITQSTVGTSWPQVNLSWLNNCSWDRNVWGEHGNHWCNGRVHRPFEDFFGIPSASLTDIARALAYDPAYASYLHPPNCDRRLIKAEGEGILSTDSSGHTGGLGNKMTADTLGLLILEAMRSLAMVRASEDGKTVVPATAVWNRGGVCHKDYDLTSWYQQTNGNKHFASKLELDKFKFQVELVIEETKAQDDWILCDSIWSAVCSPYQMYWHAPQGRLKKWHDNSKMESKSHAVGSHNLTFFATPPKNVLIGDHAIDWDTPEFGWDVEMQYMTSSFEFYGIFDVELCFNPVAPNSVPFKHMVRVDSKIHNSDGPTLVSTVLVATNVQLSFSVDKSAPITLTVIPVGSNISIVQLGIHKIITISPSTKAAQ